MARRQTRRKTFSRKPRGKRLVDAFPKLSTARASAKDTNEAARGDPSCPRGAKAQVVKNPKAGRLKYEIWVDKKCRYV